MRGARPLTRRLSAIFSGDPLLPTPTFMPRATARWMRSAAPAGRGVRACMQAGQAGCARDLPVPVRGAGLSALALSRTHVGCPHRRRDAVGWDPQEKVRLLPGSKACCVLAHSEPSLRTHPQTRGCRWQQ